MKNTILVAALAACGFAATGAEIRGVYKLAGERRLVLTEKYQAVMRGEKDFDSYGSWRVARVEGRERVIMELRSKDEWHAEMPPQVWILDILADGKGLQPRGVGKGTLAAAVDCMKAHANDAGQPPVCASEPGAYTDAVADEVAAAIAAVDAPVRVWRAQRERDAVLERIKKDPKLLRKVRFEYPEIDPEESVPDGETLHMQYSSSMRVVFDVLWDTGVKIDRATLDDMLDRVDWKRGEVLAFWILGRDELDAATLRKYAPQVLERIGKTDRFLLRKYFRHPNLPPDIQESARQKGWSE